MTDPEVLGADLADLYRTGHSVLPGAARSLHSAYLNNPTYYSYVFERPAGLGVSDTGPADRWKALAEQLDKALLRNQEAMEKIGHWMVNFTQDVAETDSTVAGYFKQYGGKLEA